MNDSIYEAGILNSVHEVEKNILISFIEICDKHNLKYFLLGGSCLGAIRHKGFIPWDDDIDIGMPRPDYEIFLSVADWELPSHYFLQTFDTDNPFFLNYAKIRDCRTTFIEKSISHLPINHGIFIDLFPLDGGGDTKESAIKQLKKSYWYTVKIIETYCNYNYSLFSIKRLVKKIITTFFLPNTRQCIKEKEAIIRKFDYYGSKWVANYNGAWGEKEIMPAWVFGKGETSLFEGIEVIVPEKYDEYLTLLYGDYMQIPPYEKRISHHNCLRISSEVPYIKMMHVEKK